MEQCDAKTEEEQKEKGDHVCGLKACDEFVERLFAVATEEAHGVYKYTAAETTLVAGQACDY